MHFEGTSSAICRKINSTETNSDSIFCLADIYCCHFIPFIIIASYKFEVNLFGYYLPEGSNSLGETVFPMEYLSVQTDMEEVIVQVWKCRNYTDNDFQEVFYKPSAKYAAMGLLFN